MMWRRMLIAAAAIAALCLSLNLCLRARIAATITALSSDGNAFQQNGLDQFFVQDTDPADGMFPFAWQHTQREQLRALLEQPEQMPTGSDEVALARCAEYALLHGDEQIIREGMRRDPHNALYHYLLADLFIHQGLQGDWPKSEKQTGTFHYEYTITDRGKLDQGMRELALGLPLPFQTHRVGLLHAQLAAMPPTRDFSDRIREIAILAAVLFPEYAKVRNLARVNGFYLSTLLAEGKRAEAEPFLHTGEHLVVQMANDVPPTLIGQLVTLAVGATCQKQDARVCRTFGLTREAAMIEAHQEVLIGKLREWKEHGRLSHKAETEAVIQNYGGILPGILLPVFGSQPAGLITRETLRPSRLLEYAVAEGGIVAVLSLFVFMLLVYSGLKYWRWKIASGGAAMPAPEIALSSVDWLRILCYGLLMPLALYLLYISIPAISWRDHGIRSAVLPFGYGIVVFVLWTLIVPTTMAAVICWKRGIAAGLITFARPWAKFFGRLPIAILSAIWTIATMGNVLITLSLTMLSLAFARLLFSDMTHAAIMAAGAFMTLAIPLLPAIWERHYPDAAPRHLATARTMITLYAVMTLFFASLYPVCTAFERHYVRIDRIFGSMKEGDNISFTGAESQLTLMLRQYVRDGATELGLSWE